MNNINGKEQSLLNKKREKEDSILEDDNEGQKKKKKLEENTNISKDNIKELKPLFKINEIIDIKTESYENEKKRDLFITNETKPPTAITNYASSEQKNYTNLTQVNEEKKEINKKEEIDKQKKDNKKSRNKKNNKKNEKTKEDVDKFLIKNKKLSIKEKEKIIEKGFENWKNEWDFFLLVIISLFSHHLDNFKEFVEDYTFYIYNNLRGIRASKELTKLNKKTDSFDKLCIESSKFDNKRYNVFINKAKEYNLKTLNYYINKNNNTNNNITNNTNRNININNNMNNTNNKNINNTNNHNINNTNNNNMNNNSMNNTNNNDINNNINNNTSNNINNNTSNNINNNISNNINNNVSNNNNEESSKINLLKDEYKIELFTAGLIDCILLRNEKDEEKYEKDKKEKQGIIPVKFEILNFNISEDSMMGIISGIKFNNNITEINLSGNMLGPKSCFWLGTIFKTDANIRVLDLTRCNLDNDCLYMLVEGATYSNENLNNEQFNLERLNLKDNNQIVDIQNDKFEHPLGIILRKFKLKWLNLTNAKLGNSGVCKFLRIYLDLMKENKIFMENLILICNNFENEECLALLGDIISQKNSTLKTLILSKNLISQFPSQTTPNMITPTISSKNITPVENIPQNQEKTESVNYFQIFMNKLQDSGIQELFLINCGIGNSQKDVEILYDMLCKNKSLISLRLFGNNISSMENFSKILGVFSEFKNNLKNDTLKSLDLSKNQCNIIIDNDFLELIEKLKLEYLDINQNTMDQNQKELFRRRTNELSNIKIIY